MSGKEAPGPAPRFRLRGEVGGVERRYLLPTEGHARLGSVGDNDIVLPVRGVSKRHALLRTDASGLILEDLGSKNGVLVNGARVQRTLLNAGDEIRIGPVSLLFEPVAEGDADIAIVLRDPASAPEAGLPAGRTTTLTNRPGQPSEAVWLAVIEASLAEVGASPEAAPGALLGVLLRELSVESASLLEWDRGGAASVIAHRGRTQEPLGEDVVQRLQRSVPDDTSVGRCSVSIESDGQVLACAALRCSERRFVGLALRGDFAGREDSAPLLRTLLRLAEGLRSGPREGAIPPPDSRVPELVFPSGYVVGDSPAIRTVYRQLRPLLQGDLPVLLLGETGVGKEWLARILHASSSRRDGPFIAVNCAAIPADLLEAELFGIGKAVATGVAEREGSFQRADRGTLFLDEIGDMSAGLQAKLLRALQCPSGEAIDSTLLSEQVLTPATQAAPPAAATSLRLDENVSLVEERVIRQALARAGGNRTRAAKLLGISRNGLAIKMERLGIEGEPSGT